MKYLILKEYSDRTILNLIKFESFSHLAYIHKGTIRACFFPAYIYKWPITCMGWNSTKLFFEKLHQTMLKGQGKYPFFWRMLFYCMPFSCSYHKTSGPSWAITRAWTSLGWHISLALLVRLLCSLHTCDSFVYMPLFNIFYNKSFTTLELNCSRQPILAWLIII